jgi:acetyl esterase/lipase
MTLTPTERLDPELAPVIGAFPAFQFSAETLPHIRAAIPLGSSPTDRVTVTDHVVPGDPPTDVRVHRPADRDDPLPCVISMHGGGYLMGGHGLDDELLARWCPDLGIVGVSVDYRLAPEVAYPGQIEDCYATLAWVHHNADRLGVQPGAIGVRGLSAGGGLAAGLALLARDRGELDVAFQLLDSAMLDDRMQTPSIQVDGLPVWSRESNDFAWRAYLGALFGTDDVPSYAAPARADDLTGLPPAFVSVGAVDGFVDEDVDYALRLNRAGVATELHVYPGVPHGYQIAAGSSVVRRSDQDQRAWLERQLRSADRP